MKVVEVFADVACPFTHVGLRRFAASRRQAGGAGPVLRVRAWPLELVNGKALDGPSLVPKIEALRADVAADLFVGFNPDRFPMTTLPAMAAEAAAYRRGLDVGERFSFAVRSALFEEGLDVSDQGVLRALCEMHEVPEPTEEDRSAVDQDLLDGKERGVAGSPHSFTADGDFFCPSLRIEHHGDDYEVSFDPIRFQKFLAAALS